MKDIKLIRAFIIASLDDDNGINSHAYNRLLDLSKHYEIEDILTAVRVQDDRWYLPERHGIEP